MRAEGTQEALDVVENLEGRKKGNLEAAEKTNMDFYNFHQILIVFTHSQVSLDETHGHARPVPSMFAGVSNSATPAPPAGSY